MARLIGVLGGTFDPPHVGHMILAEFGRAALSLDEVLWVLTPFPPHKPDQPITPVEHRLAMVEAVIAEHSAFSLSRADLDRPPPHYAHGTMEALRASDSEARWSYLMGSDSLNDLIQWDQPQRFVGLCDSLGVMRRRGAEIDLDRVEEDLPGITEKIRIFDAPYVDVSGREIRKRVRQGLTIRYLVSDPVLAIVSQRKLYQNEV